MITPMTDTVIEKREPPQWVVDHITKLGGLNRYNRPNYRVTWGANRFHTVGGMFKKVVTVKDEMIIGRVVAIVTQVAELRQINRYRWDRWHLERWRGPEFYGSREDWYQQTWDEESQLHSMGGYPSEGDYEHCFYLAQCSHMKPGDTEWCRLCQVTSGEYIPLEENIHILEMQINALRMSEDVSKDAEQKALFLREDKKRQEYSKIVGERVRNAMRPKLVINPSTLRDDTGQCSVPDAGTTRVGIDRKDVKLGLTQS